jgi:signal transduction histidine kinase
VQARGARLGSLVLASSEPGRHLPADLDMAEELGRRLALAAENARLYRQTQAAVEARDVFLSVASHELRTPLTPLLITFQRLLGSAGMAAVVETAPPEKVREMLGRCERQVKRLTALIDALLDVSRIAAGSLQIQPAPCDLTEVAREVVGRFSDQASQTGSPLIVRADEPVKGAWDRMRLEQVVTNLLSNAFKYGNGGPIQVSVARQNGDARLVVQDSGIGIEPDKLPIIFERFERAPSASGYGGLGLGLYIARELVQAHGGRIDVESAPGRGTCFTVRLPLAP